MLKDRRNPAFEQINLVQMNLRFLWILSKLLQIRFRVLSIAGNIYWFCLLVLPPGSGALFRGKIINPTDKFYQQDKNNNIIEEFWRLTTVRAGFLNFTKTLRWFFSVPMRLKWPSSRTQLSRARGGRAPPPIQHFVRETQITDFDSNESRRLKWVARTREGLTT